MSRSRRPYKRWWKGIWPCSRDWHDYKKRQAYYRRKKDEDMHEMEASMTDPESQLEFRRRSVRQELPCAPDGENSQCSSENKTDAEPEPLTFIPLRYQLVGRFEQSLVGTQGDEKLLAHHLRGVLEQLNLFFAQDKALAKGDHFVLLLKQEKLGTGQVSLAARRCSCYGGCVPITI